MSRSIGMAHIVRQEDGTSAGVWAGYILKTAFQPIFAFADGKLSVAAFEGLLRPFREGEPVSPGAFFASVAAADRLHVETLSRTIHLLNAGACLDPSTSIFVNFDPSLFCERSVADNALREMRLVLHEADIDPRRVVCELTEQKTSSDSELYMFVQALRAHGFRIAVDDYGAEESGIQRINELKPDIVKFDAHWISRLMTSGPGVALLSTMVSQFRARGIETVFEGIEENWQLELAEQSGASMVQGFVLARPELAPTSFAVFAGRRAAGTAQAGGNRVPRPDTGRTGTCAQAPGTDLRPPQHLIRGFLPAIHRLKTGLVSNARRSLRGHVRSFGRMTMQPTLPADRTLLVDEIGIEYARWDELVLKTVFQPVFRCSGELLEPCGVEGMVRPLRKGRQVPASDFLDRLTASERGEARRLLRRLHICNYPNIGVGGLRLFFNWEAAGGGDDTAGRHRRGRQPSRVKWRSILRWSWPRSSAAPASIPMPS